MFYTYSQNNSGGSFRYDEARGITHYVIIEADNAAHADSRAEEIGLYFDGCNSGRDCDCCGDRWSPAWGEGDEAPSVYGKPVRAAMEFTGGWMKSGREICIHNADGTMEWFGALL